MFRRGLGRLSANGADAVVPQKTIFQGLSPPHGFAITYTLGSAQFQLLRKTTDCVTVVSCNVPSTVLQTVDGGTRRPQRRDSGLRVRRQRKRDAAPVAFSCGVSLDPRVCPFHIELVCQTFLGQLVVESVYFRDDPAPRTSGPEASASEMIYQGPNITQVFLAEALCSRERGPSSVLTRDTIHPNPFDKYANYLASPLQRYGHMPVHTVNPKLADSLAEVLTCCHIDDELARFVQAAATAVQQEERHVWHSVSAKEFL